MVIQVLFKERIYKFFWIERKQIAHLLAHSNKSHGQTQFARDRDHHSAFCGAIELAEHDTSYARRLRKLARLLQSILPGSGVHHQQRFVRSPGNNALGGAAHFIQL